MAWEARTGTKPLGVGKYLVVVATDQLFGFLAGVVVYGEHVGLNVTAWKARLTLFFAGMSGPEILHRLSRNDQEVTMIDHDSLVVAGPQAAKPAWIVLTAAFFHEESLSRRGAAYRLVFLAVVLALIVAALVAESRR